MEIKIQVDETQFKTLMENTLQDLPKEKLEEVMLEGLRTYLSQKEVLDAMFFYARDNYGWSKKEAKQELWRIMEGAFKRDEQLNEIADMVVQQLRDNHMDILKRVIVDALINGLGSQHSFCDAVRKAVNR